MSDVVQQMHPCHVTAFLSEHELAVLGVARTWHRSTVHDRAGRLVHDPLRTSSQGRLDRAAAQAMLTHKVRALLGIPLDFEEGSFVKYEPGQRYGVHGDAVGLERGREWTVLVCIQPADAGGATRFPHLNRQYALQRGDALLWRNYTDEGVEDARMDHEARSVRSGTKIVANAWFSAAAASPARPGDASCGPMCRNAWIPILDHFPGAQLSHDALLSKSSRAS